jgi:hypothetical protein
VDQSQSKISRTTDEWLEWIARSHPHCFHCTNHILLLLLLLLLLLPVFITASFLLICWLLRRAGSGCYSSYY